MADHTAAGRQVARHAGDSAVHIRVGEIKTLVEGLIDEIAPAKPDTTA
ncbi:hypothetical protein [Streptomyces sp. SCL15-6]|jgi:hypothetical protein|nr:hypothetical protein [Streptomyces sp. SCL15-6]